MGGGGEGELICLKWCFVEEEAIRHEEIDIVRVSVIIERPPVPHARASHPVVAEPLAAGAKSTL